MFLLTKTEPLIIAFIVIIAIVVIVFLAYYFSLKQVIIRTLLKTPTKPIGGLKTNEFTKITGKALHVKNPLIAPLSKRKCIFYSIKIQQQKSNGKSSYWKTLVNEREVQDFFIEKNGDLAIVKPVKSPKNFTSYLVVDKKTSSGTFSGPTPEFEALLKSYNIDSSTYFGFNKQLRYTEAIIEVGEEITVAGIAKWKSLSEPIPEYPYSKIASLESNEKQKILITDLPKQKVNQRKK